MGIRAVEVVVAGRVQGVFFRAQTRERADRLGLAGWVRNAEDGTVIAHLEGPEDAVEAMVDWCHHGPPRAQVVDVQVSDAEPTGTAGFDVLD